MNIQWDKTIGGSSYESMLGSEIQEIRKNVYMIGGLSFSPISGDKTIANIGDADFWLVTLDASHPLGIVANNTNAITAQKNSQAFFIFPNPVKSKLYVHTNGKVSLVLLDQSGKQVLTQTIENSGIINVSNLATGFYYLQNNTTGQTQKVVVEK